MYVRLMRVSLCMKVNMHVRVSVDVYACVLVYLCARVCMVVCSHIFDFLVFKQLLTTNNFLVLCFFGIAGFSSAGQHSNGFCYSIYNITQFSETFLLKNNCAWIDGDFSTI